MLRVTVLLIPLHLGPLWPMLDGDSHKDVVCNSDAHLHALVVRHVHRNAPRVADAFDRRLVRRPELRALLRARLLLLELWLLRHE